MEGIVSLKTSHSGCVRGLKCIEEISDLSAVTVGNFDGVHRGHQHLIDRLLYRARQMGLKSVVLSFYPHPLKVLSASQTPCELTDLRERAELMLERGVDLVVFIRFDRRFARLSAVDFIREVLLQRLKCRHLVVGYDWRFGYRREGEIELAKELGRELGFSVEEIEPFRIDGHVVSSTLIRRLLHAGRLEEAVLYLGRNYAVRRKVVSGDGRGSLLGFPTANLQNTENLCLREGVYAVKVDDMYIGVANYGVRPTFGSNKRLLEVHLLDFNGNLRGKRIKVEFLKFIREERKFSSVEELKNQIRADISAVRRLLQIPDI